MIWLALATAGLAIMLSAAPAVGAGQAAAKSAAPLELEKPAAARPWQRYKVDSQGSSWPQTDWREFNNLAAGNVSPAAHPAPGFALPIQGDAERGRGLAYDRARGGSCVVCHIMGKTTPAQPGNVGPDLSSAGAKHAVRNGQALMKRKVGQLNMACVDCHTKERHANKWVRGQYLVESKGTTAHFPTWCTSRGDIWDIRKRFQWCNVSVRANELPPDAKEYGDIELALAAINRGEKVNSPGIRH